MYDIKLKDVFIAGKEWVQSNSQVTSGKKESVEDASVL